MNKNIIEDYKKKAKELVSQMTLTEKISQMQHYAIEIERLNIPSYNWWNEALHGVARAGVATMFPQAIALASTFDNEMIYRVGEIISKEGRAKYNEARKRGDRGLYKGLTFWAPNINIFRDPRWGRGHETFGEDVYLTKTMGESIIKGIQGEDECFLKAAACAKHFAVHSGPEEGRHGFCAKVSLDDLNNIYFKAFKHVVEVAEVEGIMGAYNSINGELCCGSKKLLNDILRKEWGFDGYVVSDCGAISDFHNFHKVTHSADESAALAVKAGCDLNCGHMFQNLLAAFNKGLITEEEIDVSVTRLILTRLKLGTLEGQKTPFDDLGFKDIATDENRNFAIEVAKKSLVLLKNEDNMLPIKREKIKSIAVIGPNANSRNALIGNYTGTPKNYITILEGIFEEAGKEGIDVHYSEGCHMYRDFVEPCVMGEVDDRISEAIMLCENCDMVILCLGLDFIMEGEEGDSNNPYGGADKKDLHLPKSQERLIQKLAKVNPNLVLVNISGSAIDLSIEEDKIKAIVQVFYPGAEGGKAVAEMLFGKYSPSGRLPVTFYKDSDKLPSFEDYSMEGRTYLYVDCDNVLYPFGYGLSYADFEYKQAKVLNKKRENNKTIIDIQVKVCNKSSIVSDEVVQVYLKNEKRHELCAYKRVKFMAKEEKCIDLNIEVLDLESIVLYIGGGQPDFMTRKLTGKNHLELHL